jgi:hypothetical protein
LVSSDTWWCVLRKLLLCSWLTEPSGPPISGSPMARPTRLGRFFIRTLAATSSACCWLTYATPSDTSAVSSGYGLGSLSTVQDAQLKVLGSSTYSVLILLKHPRRRSPRAGGYRHGNLGDSHELSHAHSRILLEPTSSMVWTLGLTRRLVYHVPDAHYRLVGHCSQRRPVRYKPFMAIQCG